jgi:hypothetical protein
VFPSVCEERVENWSETKRRILDANEAASGAIAPADISIRAKVRIREARNRVEHSKYKAAS